MHCRDGTLYGKFDEESFKLEMEYDAIQRRGPSQRTPMTFEQARKVNKLVLTRRCILMLYFCQLVPGWGKVQQYAKDSYREGGVNIGANPSEPPVKPAPKGSSKPSPKRAAKPAPKGPVKPPTKAPPKSPAPRLPVKAPAPKPKVPAPPKALALMQPPVKKP
ncbi:unnamed protein product [Cyclocybe aegerita]|uniref:Uncharacterized protein n=1 Tax=Cyclocybe aegerita TaxID=1973307 RepID=A0A8S0WZR8_CYCAE|nr:unnamed protein product [Cyclocybe aegerita]